MKHSKYRRIHNKAVSKRIRQITKTGEWPANSNKVHKSKKEYSRKDKSWKEEKQ